MKKITKRLAVAVLTAALICIGIGTYCYAEDKMPGPPPGGPNSSLITSKTESGTTTWTMANDAIKAVVEMKDGSIETSGWDFSFNCAGSPIRDFEFNCTDTSVCAFWFNCAVTSVWAFECSASSCKYFLWITSVVS